MGGGSGVDAQSCSHPSHCAWCHHSNPDPNTWPHSMRLGKSILHIGTSPLVSSETWKRGERLG